MLYYYLLNDNKKLLVDICVSYIIYLCKLYNLSIYYLGNSQVIWVHTADVRVDTFARLIVIVV